VGGAHRHGAVGAEGDGTKVRRSSDDA